MVSNTFECTMTFANNLDVKYENDFILTVYIKQYKPNTHTHTHTHTPHTYTLRVIKYMYQLIVCFAKAIFIILLTVFVIQFKGLSSK